MRNKTIRVAPDSEEGKKYLARCVSVTEPVSSLDSLRDKTVFGDCFAVLPSVQPPTFWSVQER